LRQPDVFLNVGSAPRVEQLNRIIDRFGRVLRRFRPHIVIVVGDVNSTLGAARAAMAKGIRIAHVEAGLRSFDKTMPEEINRILTDSMSDFLFTTSRSADENLLREGIPKKRIYFVGNVMIDTLAGNIKEAEKSDILERLGISRKGYYLFTLHRPSNVDDINVLKRILNTVRGAGSGYRVVFPVHPRTEKMLKKFGLMKRIKTDDIFLCTKPLGYIDFLALMRHCRLVLTDSGGIQEETAYLKIPCLTLRDNTERPITVEAGNNLIVGNTARGISDGFKLVTDPRRNRQYRPIKFWDGRASNRIVRILLRKML
jgi:UDP-N-acetylglucosamine 2-epimerase (non-hydrolysing)